MIVAGSSVWIDYFNGRITPETQSLDGLLGQKPIVIGDLILMEVLLGFRHEREFDTAAEVLAAFECQPMLGHDMAIASARNYRRLRALGVTVRKSIDVVIGTFCIANEHVLLHPDRDFMPMVRHLGLRTVTKSG